MAEVEQEQRLRGVMDELVGDVEDERRLALANEPAMSSSGRTEWCGDAPSVLEALREVLSALDRCQARCHAGDLCRRGGSRCRRGRAPDHSARPSDNGQQPLRIAAQ